jgi:hypothetical protein
MPRKSLHCFTAIQLGLFMLLFFVKSIKTIAIAFPIIIALCIPFRVYVLPKIFTEEELIMLDSDESTIQNWLAAKQKLAENENCHAETLPEKTEVDRTMHVADLINLEDEDRDQVTPLPNTGDGASQGSCVEGKGPPQHRRRVKSVSCPTNGSLFGDDEYPLEIRIRAHEHDHVETSEPTPEPIPDPDVEAGPTTLRRRRQKTISCPPHMLFMEAEKHVNANYFFG